MISLENQKSPIEWKRLFESDEFESNFYYAGEDLGCTYSEKETVFKLWAPTATKVVLNLYKTGSDEEEEACFLEMYSLQNEGKGVWRVRVEHDIEGVYYTYTVYANGDVQETADPYARACGVNGKRSMVVDLKTTNPENWEKDQLPSRCDLDPVIYELHIKDFSSDIHSGIKQEWQGKYLAFTQKNSSLKGEGKYNTCMAYLKKLGITYVQLLPGFDYASVDESKDSKNQFNWGYDPLSYNIPEGSYATNAFDGHVRINEFKQMVKALHEEGLGVIMDVVYNHTFDTNSSFQKTVPYYYYRVDENGDFSNGSCCGNDTASERAMFRKYMIDSVCYFAKEYHIDGFRFDLMALHDIETMNQIRSALDKLPNGKEILMYGEPWRADVTAMKKESIPALKAHVDKLDARIAIFNDDTRDAIKGSVFFAKKPGFINGGEGLKEKIKSSVVAWCDGKAKYQPNVPNQTISYVSAHDNYTLWDKIVYTLTEKIDFKEDNEKAVRLNKMAVGIYMTCLGIPFFQAGEEFARTKLGEENSYKSSSVINELDWTRAAKCSELVEYYKGLIALRKQFRAYWSKQKEIIENISFIENDNEKLISFVFKGIDAPEDKWKELFITYNANEGDLLIDLPEGKWQLLSNGKQILAGKSVLVVEDKIKVYAESVMILGKMELLWGNPCLKSKASYQGLNIIRC